MLEVAGELRALRAVVQRSAASSPPPAEKVDVAAFLEPLRAVLGSVAERQESLEQRQLAVVQELQRWSKLVADQASGTAAARTDAEAIAARLAQLEASMRQQDERHRQMEAELGAALDRTAERLGAFLDRLQGVVETAGSAGASASPVALPSAIAGEAPKKGERERLAWFATLMLAGAVASIGSWQWLRSDSARRITRRDETEGVDAAVAQLVAEASQLAESDAQMVRPEAGGSGRRVDAQAGADSGQELLVVAWDGEDAPALTDPAGSTAVEPPAETVAAVQPRAVAPAVRRWCLPSASEAAAGAVLSALQDDARVLRRPAPAVVRSEGMLVAEFVPLPWLGDGELAHLEHCLRTAAREA